ncbi:CBN-CIR-1 protein [Caenorhabditis brenneri]|uniref:CBN-CIR-1 protein n=1 Tax=Caenorhabditis brenneri TaxID=135651 RepID=G0ND16_CAEBE|nr:CBN-CIR-1 protein [Caenorhabditis brenneri]
MGKGFQNFMSKKDFHPSAFRNLKMVWEARQKKSLEDKRQEELRVAYEKEQEILNNKALLGDEKAKMGLSFMYDAPAGMTKREEPKEEPKFEWQRKYQAPREDWAKGNEDIQDQPFGIQVRNVRCCKCHKWGHINTDRECPLFGKSGNFEDEGYANNPSDLIKDLRKQRQAGTSSKPTSSKSTGDDDEEWMDHQQLASDMREEHGIVLKGSVLSGMQTDQQLARMKNDETSDMLNFINSLSEKEQKKLQKMLISGGDMEDFMLKKYKKDKKKAKKEEKKAKKREIKQEEPSSEESEPEENPRRRSPSPVRRRRHDSGSPDVRRNGNGRERSRSPFQRRRSPSPVRRRRDSRSPQRKSRRHDSGSPDVRRNGNRSRSPFQRRRSPSPARRRHDSRSPDVRRNGNKRHDSREYRRKEERGSRRS